MSAEPGTMRQTAKGTCRRTAAKHPKYQVTTKWYSSGDQLKCGGSCELRKIVASVSFRRVYALRRSAPAHRNLFSGKSTLARSPTNTPSIKGTHFNIRYDCSCVSVPHDNCRLVAVVKNWTRFHINKNPWDVDDRPTLANID